MSGVLVGTSGWSYDHWRGVFYPEDLPRAQWFEYYTRCFRSVEVNYTFYRLPSESTVGSWRERAGRGFLFALKGSRLVTHRLRLRGCSEALGRFHDRALGLGDRLGVVLWQLPPDLERDVALLDDFLEMLPTRTRVAVEFRHESWLHEATHSVMQRHNAAEVWVSSGRMPVDFTVTADFVYVRFHGLADGYAHDYTAAELEPWLRHLKGKEGFAYFNNDAGGRAPANAMALTDLLAAT